MSAKKEETVWTAGTQLSPQWLQLIGEITMQWSITEYHVDSMLSMLRFPGDAGKALNLPVAGKLEALAAEASAKNLGEQICQDIDLVAKELIVQLRNRNMVVHGCWRETESGFELLQRERSTQSVELMPVTIRDLRDWIYVLYLQSVNLMVLRLHIAQATRSDFGKSPQLDGA